MATFFFVVAGVILIGFLSSLAWVAFLVATNKTEMPKPRHNDDYGGEL